jgi:hypothetical protein
MVFYFLACANSPDFDIVPRIEFVALSKSQMVQCPITDCDTLSVTINFEDGDGDIGSDQIIDLFVIDNRTGESYDDFVVPMLPKQGAANGISGQLTFTLMSTCCEFPNNIPDCEAPAEFPTNEISLDIFIEDRAKNRSNTVTTSTFTLLCQ